MYLTFSTVFILWISDSDKIIAKDPKLELNANVMYDLRIFLAPFPKKLYKLCETSCPIIYGRICVESRAR